MSEQHHSIIPTVKYGVGEYQFSSQVQRKLKLEEALMAKTREIKKKNIILLVMFFSCAK